MADANFRVIITGEIAADFEYSAVVNTAARLFKCTPAQAQKLLGNQPTTLKRAMDKQTAVRYCQQLLKAGIICRIENDAVYGKVDINRPIAHDSATQTISLVGGLPAEKPILRPDPITNRATQEPHPDTASSSNAFASGGLSLEPMEDKAEAEPAPSKMPEAKPHPTNVGLSLVDTPAANSARPEAPSNTVFEPTATHEIICPKCKNIQRIASECSHCGVVFSKYVGDKRDENIEQQTHQEEVEEQAKEWDELSWFVGENFEAYQQKFVAIANNDDKFVAQWHWPAFLVPYAWYVHRKLYAFFGAYLAYYCAMIIIGVAPFISALIGNTACALSANYLYYRHAKRKIAECDDDIDGRRIDIIETGGTNSIFLTLAATLGLILLSWILIFNFMVKPVINAVLDSIQEDQAFISKGHGDKDKTTRANMVMLKNVVIGTKIAKEMTGEEFPIPNDMDELRDAFKLEPAAADLQFRDGWDKPMHYYGDEQRIKIESAGADGEWNSEDDIVLISKVPSRE